MLVGGVGALALALWAAPADAAPTLGGQLYSLGGTVTVEILPADANDTSELRLCSPGPELLIATNRDVGRVVTIGPFPGGTELVFCIVNLNHGWKFFMGPASRNPDGIEHAIVDLTGPGVAIVGFEDVLGGFDRDFNDNVFRFTGVALPPPMAADDPYMTDEDVPLVVPASGVLANDTDVNNDPLTAILVAGPSNGTLVLNPDGSFTYTPNANWSGTDSFRYKTNDGTADSNVATAVIVVRPVNDPPVASNDPYVTDEDVPLVVLPAGVLANDTDVDGGPLSATLVSGPANGAVALGNDGSFTYTPTANWFGTDTFVYRANDGQANSNDATVTIVVRPVNDPPSCAAVRGDVALLWPPNHKFRLVTLSGATDVDGDLVTSTVTAVTQDEPLNGLGDGDTSPDAMAGPAGNSVRLRAERSGTGDGRVYVVSYTASDGNGGTCSGTVRVAVPHDQGAGSTAIDSGQTVNSFGG